MKRIIPDAHHFWTSSDPEKRYNRVSTSGETNDPDMTISSAVFTITVISHPAPLFLNLEQFWVPVPPDSTITLNPHLPEQFSAKALS